MWHHGEVSYIQHHPHIRCSIDAPRSCPEHNLFPGKIMFHQPNRVIFQSQSPHFPPYSSLLLSRTHRQEQVNQHHLLLNFVHNNHPPTLTSPQRDLVPRRGSRSSRTQFIAARHFLRHVRDFAQGLQRLPPPPSQVARCGGTQPRENLQNFYR